ncbi:MAG: hypothetical protein JOY54_13095 [Acidobacteriaceae bacterium]|nr:hypothetical protein [Acidobacteriaceae bacterium]
MKNATLHLRAAIWVFIGIIRCYAQASVAPTTETVGPTRGDTWRDYNVVNSFEVGYRLVTVSGNTQMYDSQINFHDGVRLFSSFFTMDSKNGHGLLFDQAIVTTNGLGGDPYSSATVRVQKNRIYEYNLLWRNSQYFNPGLTTDGGAGEHLLDTSYTLQDHNLTLFPQSSIRFSLGYSRNDQSGAGISTVQLFQTNGPFDPSGDVFPLFENVKLVQNDYRLGTEVHWLGFVLTVMHGWEDFKDDTPYQFTGNAPGDNPLNSATLTSFYRAQPYHGTSPYWQVALFRDSKWISFNGRFTYTGGVRSFVINESAIGTNQFGALANQQILAFGNASRPAATGNLNITLLPTSKLTIASRTSVYNIRTEGNSAYLQYDNATQSSDLLYFQFLGIRTVETDLSVQYQLRNWLDLHGGYAYSDRLISSSPQFAFTNITSPVPYTQTNILNSGTFGLRLKPVAPLTILLDGEIGHASQPFTPKGDRNYNAFSGRIQYKIKNLQLMALSNTDYNNNSVTLSSYSSHARTFSASVSWTPKTWFSLDASYSKQHVDTLGGIAFFANAQFFPDQVSYYVSNLHSGTLAARFSLKRADLYIGYSRVQDTGDGRSDPVSTIIGPNLAAFQTAQTFPLTFQSPSARISVRITERVRWNVGYQYYGYTEKFFDGENYLANTGYTSILWSF